MKLKRRLKNLLCSFVCISIFLCTISSAIASSFVGGASGYNGDDAQNEAEAVQEYPSPKKQTLEGPDPFTEITEETQLNPMEAYANQEIIQNPLLDIMGMKVYLTRISIEEEGYISLSVRLSNQGNKGIECMKKVSVTVEDGDMQAASAFTYFADHWIESEYGAWEAFPANSGQDYVFYPVFNPDLADMMLHFSLIVREVGNEDTAQSQTVVLPIHLLGDYLTGAPKGEIHLPVPDGNNADFSVYDTTPLMSNELLTVRVVSVALGSDEGYIGLEVNTTLDQGNLSLFMIDTTVNGIPASNYGWDGFSIPIRMPDGNLPSPVENISFTLGAAGDGIDGILQSDRFTLVFDGVNVAEN